MNCEFKLFFFQFSGLTARTLSVRVGSSYHRSGGTVIPIKRIVQHKRYNSRTVDYDYSLLELSEPVTYTDVIQAVDLPPASLTIPDGTDCIVSGWGETQNASESNEKLRAAVVPTVNQAKCNRQYRGGITARMLCAGYDEGGKDSCQGDSGGPLTTEEGGNSVLVGVVSFGAGCGEKNYPGVYSRVSAVRPWIQSETGI